MKIWLSYFMPLVSSYTTWNLIIKEGKEKMDGMEYVKGGVAPHKMVKHTQTADDLLERVWSFCGVGA